MTRIVLATDGSPGAEAALHLLVRLGLRPADVVEVVTVAEHPPRKEPHLDPADLRAAAIADDAVQRLRAAGIAAIAATTLFLTAGVKADVISMVLAACLVGAALGFLRHNFSPARIIMGDSGSMFVGYVLGGISVMGLYKSFAALSLIVPILALAVPIVDTAYAIVRRFRSRRPIYLPDRGHLHHRLLDRGLSQRQTVLLLYLVSAFFGVGALVVAGVNRNASLVTLAVIAALLYVSARRMGLFERKPVARMPETPAPRA